MFIDGSCEIGFWGVNLRIEANEVVYNIELKNEDFETQVKRHEEKRKLEEGIDKRFSMNENVHRWLLWYRNFRFKLANRR